MTFLTACWSFLIVQLRRTSISLSITKYFKVNQLTYSIVHVTALTFIPLNVIFLGDRLVKNIKTGLEILEHNIINRMLLNLNIKRTDYMRYASSTEISPNSENDSYNYHTLRMLIWQIQIKDEIFSFVICQRGSTLR